MKKIRGFTLIELLMAIALIAIMATIMTSWIGSAKAKSRDSQALKELHEVQTALSLYLGEHGLYPNETPITTNPYIDNFNDMAQQLVSSGFLPRVPTPPPGHTYQFYNYGPASIGALLFTTLETYPDSTGYSGSYRPFSSGSSNWCTTDSSKDYCLCSAY